MKERQSLITNDGSLDYLIREQGLPAFICMDPFSDALSQVGAIPFRYRRDDKCVAVRDVTGYSNGRLFTIREEIEEISGNSKFLVIRQGLTPDKGFIAKNNIVEDGANVGFDVKNQKSIGKFADKFISSFLACDSYRAVNGMVQ